MSRKQSGRGIHPAGKTSAEEKKCRALLDIVLGVKSKKLRQSHKGEAEGKET